MGQRLLWTQGGSARPPGGGGKCLEGRRARGQEVQRVHLWLGHGGVAEREGRCVPPTVGRVPSRSPGG